MVTKVIDFLIQLKNSSQIFKTNFYIKKHVKFSNLLYILYKTGFIQSFSITKNNFYCIKIIQVIGVSSEVLFQFF